MSWWTRLHERREAKQYRKTFGRESYTEADFQRLLATADQALARPRLPHFASYDDAVAWIRKECQ